MRLIAHRGNINGRNKKRENEIVYILEALNLGYDAEIDIRYSRSKNDYFLGQMNFNQLHEYKHLPMFYLLLSICS